MSKTEDFIREAAKEAGLSKEMGDLLASKIGKRVTMVSDAVQGAADRVADAAAAFTERLKNGAGEIDHPEYWSPRGIGSEWNLTCLVTGKEEKLMPNISGFVRSKAAGERIVKMFNGRARLDFRTYEPNWIQVKVGVLEEHKEVLVRLQNAVMTCEGMLTPEIIQWALDPEKCPGYQPKALERIRQLQEGATIRVQATTRGCKCYPVCKCD